MQTKKGSFVESLINIVVGFAVNWTANMLVLPQFGFITLTGFTAFEIGLVFTIISFVRSFMLRRFFNWIKWGNKRETVSETPDNYPAEFRCNPWVWKIKEIRKWGHR